MKTISVFAVLLLLAQGQAAQTRAPRRAAQTNQASSQPSQPQLPVRRIILYSNGVAYFERRGLVSPHAEVNLPFKQSQVDDVLKSMLVLDLGKGRIGTVSYNSSAPASARLNDIPFSIEAGTKVYTITNQTDRPRVVFVEHPIRERWKLSDNTLKPYETSASVYRFRAELKPRATVELPIIEQLALMDSYALSNLSRNDIELFVSRRYIDDATRAALEKIIEIKSKIASVDARVAAADREAAEIGADQARLRENIKALSKETEARQLIARYVAKAAEQETRIEQITSEKRAAAAERAQLQSALDAAILALDIDRKL